MNAFSRLLLLHKNHPQPLATALELQEWLKARSIRSEVHSAELDTMEMRAKAAASDAIIILGGDGTIIGAARRLSGIRTPLVGMNFGRVGFLAELPQYGWEPALSSLLEGKWKREGHMVLRWRTLRQAEKGWNICHEGVAINDVVTAHGVVARAVSLSLNIDGVDFSTMRCDGIIVATPLGSTAYTASAGGPLTIPSMNAQLVTPICPFAGGFPPLTLPYGAQIRIEACRKGDEVLLSVDGQQNIPMAFGDVLEITGLPDQLHMLVSDEHWYLQRLISRGVVTSGPAHNSERSF